MAFSISSPAFKNGGPIPAKYSRSGSNISPPLEWHDAPPNTKSYALLVEDPDAPSGIFRHWAAYDIPPGEHNLPEGVGRGGDGMSFRMATNDFRNRQYDGPQPPHGHGTHHYHFRFAALNVEKLNLPENATAQDVLRAVRSHTIAEAETIGTFAR